MALGKIQGSSPLEIAKKGLEIHEKGRLILEALVSIEEHRISVLKQMRHFQARGKDKEHKEAYAGLIVLNQKKSEAINNYKKYALFVSKMVY